MRFKTPQHGDTRIKTKFAILPIKINNEIRWFETVIIRQRYIERLGWDNTNFID